MYSSVVVIVCGAVCTTTSVPGRQTKLRPNTSGCRVRTNTPTRHNGIPQARRSSHSFLRTSGDWGADRAPSASHSTTSETEPAMLLTLAGAGESRLSGSVGQQNAESRVVEVLTAVSADCPRRTDPPCRELPRH